MFFEAWIKFIYTYIIYISDFYTINLNIFKIKHFLWIWKILYENSAYILDYFIIKI